MQKLLRKGGGLKGARARGEAVKTQWVQDGDVVPAQQLEDSWGISRRALGVAVGRGEAFSVKVSGRLYYPREFLVLERETVAAVCKALGSLTSTEKFVFWTRTQGALGGSTISEALTTGVAIERIVRLAHAGSNWRHK